MQRLSRHMIVPAIIMVLLLGGFFRGGVVFSKSVLWIAYI